MENNPLSSIRANKKEKGIKKIKSNGVSIDTVGTNEYIIILLFVGSWLWFSFFYYLSYL